MPLGAEGTLRGNRVICIGFVIRGCTVEGERYRWREYLLYAGARVGYLWLMEEEGSWQLVTPIPPGEVQVSGRAAAYKGKHYSWKQSVQAQVEQVAPAQVDPAQGHSGEGHLGCALPGVVLLGQGAAVVRHPVSQATAGRTGAVQAPRQAGRTQVPPR